MRYRVDYCNGDKDLAATFAQAKRFADETVGGGEVFDFESMKRRGDFALSEEDVVYWTDGRPVPDEPITELTARHPDPEIDWLYRERRKAAHNAENGLMAWGYQDRIEDKLRSVDPDGDWRYEGFNYDTLRWEVHRAPAR